MERSRYLSILSIVLIVLHSVYAAKKGSSIPPDWVPRVEGGNMLFTVDEPSDVNMMGSVGNGYVATVVSSDTIYIAGVFNGLNSIGPSHRARVPATNAISIPSVTPVGSAMDVELGIFYRRSLLTVGSCVIPIEQRWYAHRVNRYLLIHEIDVNATECSQSVTVPLDNIPFTASTDINFDTVPNNLGSNVVVYQGAINTTEEPNGEVVYVAYVTPVIPDEIFVSANQFETFYYISAFRTSLDTDTNTPATDAQQTYTNAISQQESLLSSHIQQMLQVFQSRIEVWGDVDLAAAINSSMYYIVSSIREDWPFHLSPGGLSSNSYNGHSFWDGETWMYPSLLILHPELAQSMIEYRFNRIQGAEEKAQSYDAGYKGTMFPWESAFTGEEVCPTSAPTGQLEQHISGDIAFALWQYWSVTQNMTWLQTYGWPLFQGIAEFWASRVTLENGQFSINGVIPPDEYAVNVNNSVYTNVVAQYSLMTATTVGNLLGQQVPPEWLKIAQGIVIPFDETLQVHPEFDGYSGELIKQADVVLLGFPLMYPMSNTVRYNDLMYYSARTDPNGPAMTYGMQAVALLELGYAQNATAEFKRSYANIQEPFDVWTETPAGGAINFITGAGGFLQGVMFGYGGLRIKPGYLAWNPILPEGVTQMRFAGVNYVGNAFDFQFNSTDVTVTLQDVIEGASKLYLQSEGAKTVLPLYTPITVPLGPCSATYN